MNSTVRTLLSIVIGFLFGYSVTQIISGSSEIWYLPFVVGLWWFVYLGVNLGKAIKKLKNAKKKKSERQQLND